jgi:hypothetical protein
VCGVVEKNGVKRAYKRRSQAELRRILQHVPGNEGSGLWFVGQRGFGFGSGLGLGFFN